MAATIYEVLEELREAATSEADKGSKLEQLMLSYLHTDPVYAEQFSDVWLWRDWPGRDGKRDTGIDLVAVDRLTGGNVAIQCKFYAPSSTIEKGDIDSFLAASGKEGFDQRIIVSTTDRWNANAEDAVQGQQVPVRRIGLADLEASGVDWGRFSWAAPRDLTVTDRKRLRPHQREAVDAVKAGLAVGDRGKLIMACGTGKTFTSLRLAEEMVGAGGSVLFLVPSISLLSQTLREWATEAQVPAMPVAVCSDRKATVRSRAVDEDISAVDLALPSTTDVAVLEARLGEALADASSMTVVFSTYQSIDVVAQAQSRGDLGPFDLIICDEAHRTTGVTLAGEDESPFVRVHDDAYLRGRKRLYMTATPRLYDDSSKAKAGEAAAVLASMDDESVYGPELHRLSFGEAVSRDLLADYKVLFLRWMRRACRARSSGSWPMTVTSCAWTTRRRSSGAGTVLPSAGRRSIRSRPTRRRCAGPSRSPGRSGTPSRSSRCSPGPSTSTRPRTTWRTRAAIPFSRARSGTWMARSTRWSATLRWTGSGRRCRMGRVASSPTPGACPRGWTCPRWMR